MANICMRIIILLACIFCIQSSFQQTIDRRISFLRPGFGHRNTGPSRTLQNPFADFSKSGQFTVREKEIAAVFRGVAYGASETTKQTTTELSTPSISVTSKPPIKLTTRKSVEENYSLEVKDALPSDESNVVLSSTVLSSLSPYDEESNRNGILNYYVEEDRDTRRDYYPEVISSVQPETKIRSDSNNFVVSENGMTKSISVHVYLIGVLMGMIVLSSLLCLCRITSCSQLIPRGHYVTLQLLILLAASLRCITLFHDPYGLDGKLPRALMSLLVNSVAPLLSTAFALMLLVLLRASKYFLLPASLQSPLVLAVICGVHIGTSVLADVSNGVLDYPESSLHVELTMKCVTIVWNSVLVISYFILLYQVVIKTSKRRAILPASTCGVTLIAATIQAILIGFMLYHVIMKASSSELTSYERTWSWWVLISCERLLEIGLCATILTAAATLTMKQTHLTTKEQKVFSVISGYNPNTVRIISPTHKNYKTANYTLTSTLQKSGNTMNSNFSSRTLIPSSKKVCDTAADLSFQWSSMRSNKPDVCLQNNAFDGSSSGNNSSNFTRTLPCQPRYYCAPVPHIGNSPVPGRIEPHVLRPQKNNIYSEIGDIVSESYDVASYYTPSEINSYGFCNNHQQHQYERARSTDHLYDLPNVHTTVNTRNQEAEECSDARSRNTTVGSDNLFNLALPLHGQHQQNSVSRPCHHKINNSQLDTSPDSAIVLDYSSQSEMEEHNNIHKQNRLSHNKQNRKMSSSSKLDFMNLSTHSLNEVFKHNSGLLSKLVGTNINNNTKNSSGYQPLNIEESNSQFHVEEESSNQNTKSNLQDSSIGNSSGVVRGGESCPPMVSTPLLISSCPSPITSL